MNNYNNYYIILFVLCLLVIFPVLGFAIEWCIGKFLGWMRKRNLF